MDLKIETLDFFGLVTELCKSLVGKRRMEYLIRRDNVHIVNEMRITAFEILLNKHHRSHNISGNQQIEASDPIAELLKYCFVLKTTAKSFSSANKLESVLNHLMDVDGNYDSSIKSVLIFLHHLKNYQSSIDNNSDLFNIGAIHPKTPDSQWHKEVPQYQIYPLSALELPIKIHKLLHTTNHEFDTSNFKTPLSRLYQLPSGFIHNGFSIASSLISYDLNLNNNIGGTYTIDGKYIAELPWNQGEILFKDANSNEFSSIPTESDILPYSIPELSYAIDNYTWETLGNATVLVQSSFASESIVAIEYFGSSRSLQFYSGEIHKCPNEQFSVITMDKFIENSKFVLLGINSSCYVWNNALGFTFDIKTTVSELSRESLQSICSDITHWATCFKLLSLLVHANPKSDDSRPDDLIFKAMCNNIDDILIHYQAVILQVFNENNSSGLLNLLDRLQDIGFFISEVARLCRCDQICQTTLGEGTGILSHIYNEVTKITKPKIALVYYSVLKSCCEVYFQLLEKWIFEGICEEAYGEFMINIKGQYLRNRGHKFWTRCFGINDEAVPGFLKNLTDSILQCGKAVRLLKICDPKNPICHLFMAKRPTVKVCLNMVMLCEQEKICSKYMIDGNAILGSNITLSSAFCEMKAVEKAKADHVIAAQHCTLERIKRNCEEVKVQLIQSKCKLLADQKKQCEDAVSRREKVKEAVWMEEELLMKQQVIEDEKFRSKQLADAKATSDYYKDLAIEVKKQRLRATWRAKRMALFDDRMVAIFIARSDEANVIKHEQSDECLRNPEADYVQENDISLINLDSKQPNSIADNATNDENCNSSDLKTNQQQTIAIDELHRADRPTILDVTRKNIRVFENETMDSISTDAMRSPTEVLLNEIIEINHVFQESHTQIFHNSIERCADMYETRDVNDTIISNARNEVFFDDNNCNIINVDEKDNNRRTVVDNINQSTDLNGAPLNVVEELQLHPLVGNNMNDSTPMSCTTDSYVPSAMGSSLLYNCNDAGSIGESRNEFETPTTPGDCLTTNTMKHEFSIENIFTSDTQCFNPFSLDNSSPVIFESSLTKADVEIIDNTSLQVYLEKSILIPLRVQSQLANSAVVKCLLHDHKILLHLQSLRSFFFLLNGEFAKNLTGPLYTKFYEITLPVELFNSHTLTNILKNALHGSLNSSYINSEFLSLTAFESPSILQTLDPQALNCLCLHYKVSWPLNIIIDEALMQQYSKVFKFLLMVGRVLWVLQDDFCILKHERKAVRSHQYHRVQLFRHAMMQFMTALHNYITCSVLHASWAEFEKELENARTLDQIYTTHVSYIKKILSRCMLTNRGEKLRICLRNTFEIILKFHNCLRSYEWIANSTSYVHPNYKKIEQMYNAFCILRTYPAQVVDRSASSGYQMHLSHFVDALNINPLFNL